MTTRTTGDKLAELLRRCKCSVHITVNQQRAYYLTAEKYLQDEDDRECPPEIDADVRAKMVETDTVVEIQFYPDTPIGSYSVYHYDMGAALERALDCLDQN